MFGAKCVTDNAGLIVLMKSAEKGPLGKPRNRAVHCNKVRRVLWTPDDCCAAKGKELEQQKACPACGDEGYGEFGVCDECGTCMHCGVHPEHTLGAAHLCTFLMVHNTYEDRTCWMARVKEGTPHAQEMGPGMWMAEIWLDVEHGLLEKVTWSVRKEQIKRGAEMTRDEQLEMLAGRMR